MIRVESYDYYSILHYYYWILKLKLNIIMSWIPFRYDQNALRETVCQSLVL